MGTRHYGNPLPLFEGHDMQIRLRMFPRKGTMVLFVDGNKFDRGVVVDGGIFWADNMKVLGFPNSRGYIFAEVW